MPLSRLVDSDDMTRAQAALAIAWDKVQSSGEPLLGSEHAERQRLAVIVAVLIPIHHDEQQLADRAVEWFWK